MVITHLRNLSMEMEDEQEKTVASYFHIVAKKVIWVCSVTIKVERMKFFVESL